jgi:hypothetical protein
MNSTAVNLSFTTVLRVARGWALGGALALCAVGAASAQTTAAPSAAPTVSRTAFDHLTTGFELIGQHRDLNCEQCHVNAIFKGTPRNCAACHGVGAQVRATAKPLTHILTSNRCESCHTPVAFNPAVNFDHAEVQGGCSTCHNNVQAQGKPPTHIVTDLECNACHSTIGWAGAVFNHAGVTQGCAGCHNGSGATGPPANHVPIGAIAAATCEGCHTPTNYTSWKMANATGTAPPAMVHTADSIVVCSTCHEAGLSWAGAPSTKLRPATLTNGQQHPLTGECSTCHFNYVSFLGATGLPVGHIPLPNGNASTCASCHANASDYKVYNMDHSVVTGEPCSSCHAAGSNFLNMAPPVLVVTPANHIAISSAACDGCHLGTSVSPGGFKLPSNVSGTTPPAMVHTAVAGVACATCHAAGKTDIGVPPTLVPPANHIPFGSASCESCHLASSTATGGFKFSNVSATAPAAMVHTAVPGVACATCHASGLSWAGTPATVLPPANHIPINGAACEGCHLASSTAVGGFKFSNLSGTAPAAMVHTLVSSMHCSACHEAGLSWAGTPPTVLRPAVVPVTLVPHVATGECSDCHLSTVSFKGGGNYPANHIPLPNGASSNCTSCHTNTSSFLIYTMDHTVVTSESCATCHGAGKSFANMAPPTLVLAPSNHIPYGSAACDSCHLGTSTATGGFKFTNASGTTPAAMVHGAVPGVACATCHAAGKTDVGVPATVVTPANHVPIGSVACESCHLASSTAAGGFKFTNASGPAPAAMVHSAVPGVTCATCHAAGKIDVGVPATKVLPGNHVPVGSAACEGCHLASSVAAGGFKFTNATGTSPAAMVHSLVTSTVCSTCHEAGKTDVGVPPTIVRPVHEVPTDNTSPLHVVAGECSTCHSNTVSFLGATNLPANHIPLPSADGTNCALCHTTPGNYSQAVMNHVNIANNCAQCHATGKSFANMAPPTLVLPPANHVPIGSAACESCHLASSTATGGFKFANASGTTPAAMVHSAVPGVACATCHAAGKTWVGTPTTVLPPANHVPIGSAACESCHLANSTATGGFKFTNASGTAPAAMVHSAVSGVACATCHGAGKSWAGSPVTVLPPANHVPIGSAACEGCHLASSTATGGFKFTNATGTTPAAMVHSLVSATACSTCHEKGLSWAGTPATVLRPIYEAGSSGALHVTSGECSTCHFSTVSFLGAANLPANHIPLPAADGTNCALCHTTAGNYSLAVMNHVNISNNCAQCHAYGLSFANMAAPTLKQPPSGATGHIPSNPPNGTASLACELCHLPTVFTTFSGTKMIHAAVTAMTCMSCHERGLTWKTNAGTGLWTRPNGHHTGQDCGGSNCHSSRDKFAPRRAAVTTSVRKSGVAGATTAATAPGGAALVPGSGSFNHQRVAGTACVSCHNTASGTGMPATHLATTQSCHTTLAWLPVARVDHSQVQGSCVSCHNKGVATGKGSNHIASGDSCETCHTTNAWTPARFDHIAVAAHTCRSCHDGLHASGLPVNHVPTTAQCDTCHGTLGWKPAKLDHSTLLVNCVSCHNNNVALGVTASHLGTKRDCATCHSYPDWSVLRFVHIAASYPGDHKVAPACVACHTSNTEQVPWPSPADAGSCAGCHAKDFKPGVHRKTAAGLQYTADELRNCSGACHVYSDATAGTIIKTIPGPYHRVMDATFKH